MLTYCLMMSLIYAYITNIHSAKHSTTISSNTKIPLCTALPDVLLFVKVTVLFNNLLPERYT